MKFKFYFFIFLYFLLMILDAGLTYVGTPDLEYEGNPLVVVFGQGWAVLLLINFVIYLLYCAAVYYTFVKYKAPIINERKLTCYVSQLLFDRPDKFLWAIYKVPYNWKPVTACLGYSFAVALPAARILTVFEWFLFLTRTDVPAYIDLKIQIPYGRIDAIVAILIAFAAMNVWFIRQGLENAKRLKSAENKAVTPL